MTKVNPMSQSNAAIAPQTDSQPAREEVKAPENRADINIERPPVKPPEPGVVPPETTTPTIPQPPVALNDNSKPALTDITKPAANEVHGDKSLVIEQLLASFIGDRLPRGTAAGMELVVNVVPSSVVTEEGPNQHDIKITFKGGSLFDTKKAQTVATMLRAALADHPAFAGLGFNGADQEVEQFMTCQILALEPERYEQLLKPQPRTHHTFIPDAPEQSTGHQCSGAGCPSCGPKHDQPKPDTSIELPPALHEMVKQVANGASK